MKSRKIHTILTLTSAVLTCIAGVTNAAVSSGGGACGQASLVADAAAVVADQRFIGGNSAEEWREEHCPNGDLVKVAEGPGHPVDPTKVVGRWLVRGSPSSITYEYTDGPRYIFTLHRDGAQYHFCGSAATVVASGVFSASSYCGAGVP